MALIKCPECGKEVSDRAGKCPNCGFPIEEVIQKNSENDNTVKNNDKHLNADNHNIKSDKKISKRTIAIIGTIIGLAIIGMILYFVVTSDYRNYNAAQKLYSSEKYKEALAKFTELDSYENSEEMANKCEYALSVDGQFLNNLSKGLMLRWQYSDKDYMEEYGKDQTTMDSTEYVEYLKKCINCELDRIKGFESQTFLDDKLGIAAKSYISILNDSIKTVDYYIIDFNQYSQKWEKIYAERSVAIRNFVDDFGLVIDEEYQKTLNEFISNASVVDEQQAIEQAISDMLSKFVLIPTTDEWGYTTYRLTMENTTEYIFEYFYADINALDADGNIIGTGNVSQITNWNPGQKAEVDAWVNTNDASKISETTFTAHYKSGNFYK